jgi:hypothetical protein
MPMIAQPFFGAPELLSPPIKRAAYSDRTAWLMAEMSRLAYSKFEGGRSLKSLAEELSKKSDEKTIVKLLEKHLDDVGVSTAQANTDLTQLLAGVKFRLINIYNKLGTQAFLAKSQASDGAEPILILAFRGTETVYADIKADLRADLIRDPDGHRVHRGFYEAFHAVKAEIEKDLSQHKGLPVYITGHSLGGALAILAAKYIASDSLGACYTFGGPRVGDFNFADSIKTPIYRVVNAADGVPRVPPSWAVDVVIFVLKGIPFPGRDWLVKFLDRFLGYTHYGDMRYLTHTPVTPDAHNVPYSGLRLLYNPAMPNRMVWLISRVVATRGKALAQDHSIDIYGEKLKSYALRRNR